jgi:hypothetical protein
MSASAQVTVQSENADAFGAMALKLMRQGAGTQRMIISFQQNPEQDPVP